MIRQIIFSILLITVQDYASSNMSDIVFKVFEGLIISDQGNTFHASSKLSCLLDCGRTSDCIGRSYNKATGECFMLTGPSYGSMMKTKGWISMLKPYFKVFHVTAASWYALDFRAAVDMCKSAGTTIADHQDLVEAQVIGYQTCACGWVSDRNSYVVNQYSSSNCGSGGVSLCTWRSHWNVYCKLGGSRCTGHEYVSCQRALAGYALCSRFILLEGCMSQVCLCPIRDRHNIT